MRFEYNEKGEPVIKMEESGVRITISFSDNPKHTNLKESIIDLLTSAYENRLVTKKTNHIVV